MTSSTDENSLREMMRRTLTQPTGGTSGSSTIRGARITTWHSVADHLTPLIGQRAVEVLFARSLRLASATYPWSGARGNAPSAASFRQRLQSHDPEAAAEASEVVLRNFSQLLVGIIGEPLSTLLLAATPSPPSPAGEAAR